MNTTPVIKTLKRKAARSENGPKRISQILMRKIHLTQAAPKEGRAIFLTVNCAGICFASSDIDVHCLSAEECREDEIMSDEGIQSIVGFLLFFY
jgi:hypothetical protein